MGLPIIGDIIGAVKDVVSEVVVDKDKKNEINLQLQQLEDQANARIHEELMGQIEVNKIEAANQNVFVSGWRPFIGWTCGIGLMWTFLASPFLEWGSRLFGWAGKMPEVDTGQLTTLLLAILGVGGMRTYEKVKGVNDTKQIKD